MGAAELIVCGVSTNVILDGLYVDHKTNRVSVPMMSASQLYDPQIKACLALPLQKRTVEIVYRPDIATDPDGVRQHKKMKILSVEVCKSFIISIVSSFPVMNILVLFSTSLLSTFNLTLLLSETAIVTSIVTISMWETMCCNGQDSSYSFVRKA
jgi:membrane-associated HD superfamily phosphohydrolase